MRPDAELSELLSAYLDGELTAEEQAEVEAYLDRSAAAREELAGLDRARSLVRDLPAVDPPFGFYERAILDERRAERAERPGADASTAGTGSAHGTRAGGPRSTGRRPSRWPGLVAVGSAAAAMLLVVGVTPVGDRVAPPVAAFAERHDEMSTPGPAIGGPPASAAPATTMAATTAEASDADLTFVSMPPAEVDAMAGPYAVPVELAGYRRTAVYHTDGGTLHVVYQQGGAMISVYEQLGTVDWGALPDGERMTVHGDKAWASKSAPGAAAGRRNAASVVVVERPPLVLTMVASMGHDDMVTMADALPEPASRSLLDRAREACADVVSRFGLGG